MAALISAPINSHPIVLLHLTCTFSIWAWVLGNSENVTFRLDLNLLEMLSRCLWFLNHWRSFCAESCEIVGTWTFLQSIIRDTKCARNVLGTRLPFRGIPKRAAKDLIDDSIKCPTRDISDRRSGLPQ